LLDGSIDVIATDHAPHTLEEKQAPYFQAPSGGPLVQHAVVAVLEMVRKGVLPLERAVELRPNDGNIAESLGWALYKLGDIPGAVRWLEKAVELESQSSVINDHLGDAYWAQGRRREALFQWRRALMLGPEGGEGPKIEAKIADGLAPQPAAETRR
jgi:tetratricopeptide (TPR) repeat protein